MKRPSAPDAPPGRLLAIIGRTIATTVDEAMQEHLRVHHASQKHVEAGCWLNRLYRAIGLVIEDVIERHEHRHYGGPPAQKAMTHFRKPSHDRGIGVILADWENR